MTGALKLIQFWAERRLPIYAGMENGNLARHGLALKPFKQPLPHFEIVTFLKTIFLIHDNFYELSAGESA
jgi:hypothetical protein